MIPRLAAAVNQLTRTHKARLEVDGTVRFVDEEPLLQMLLNAWMDTGGGAGSGVPGKKQKMPINAPAMDLYNEIRYEALGLARNEGMNPLGSTEIIINTWANHTANDRAADIAENWVSCIRSLFDPVKKHRIKGNCPACEQPGLIATALGQQSTVDCNGCGAIWVGEQLHDLAHMILEAA